MFCISGHSRNVQSAENIAGVAAPGKKCRNHIRHDGFSETSGPCDADELLGGADSGDECFQNCGFIDKIRAFKNLCICGEGISAVKIISHCPSDPFYSELSL